jgi:hypothetical protein
MKSLRSLGLLAVSICLAAALPAAASATELMSGSGMVTSGSTVSAESEGSISFTGPAGVECTGSSVSLKTTNTGGASETVKANVETLDYTGCNQTVTVLAKGTLEIHTQGEGGNGTLTSSGTELTIKWTSLGIDCIYSTSSTDLGTLTGSTTTASTATIDVSATVPRTGGSFFCGSTGKWEGSYKVTTPDALNVDIAVPPAATTLTTSLSGEEKSGEEITVLEGSKVKDQATLSGANVATATGTIKYFVYSDSKCEKLVVKAGETAFTEGKVPASEEKTLEAGAVYYWQAEYTGDSKNAASKSTCGKEILTIKAATSLATSLSGEEKSGEEITVNEGAKVKDTATLSGTKSSTATGKAKYKVYSDSKCEKLVAEAGEVTVAEGKVPVSEEKTLEAGAVYYWQASYEGDSLHQSSKSTCGKEVLTIKAAVTISTMLIGQAEGESEEGPEGKEITVAAGSGVADTATLSGTNSAKATGTVEYVVYNDSKCEELAAEAGEAEVTEGGGGPSEPLELEEGTYYWRAFYGGDTLHQSGASACDEVATVIAPTSLATTLSGEAEEGEVIEVSVDAAVTDSAILSGPKSAEATGTVEYFVYADPECEEMVAEAGEVEVEGATVPASEPVELEEPGLYYWQAVYSGGGGNQGSVGTCGAEVQIVLPRITTELSAGETSGAELEVATGTPVTDQATVHGVNAPEATGTGEYFVYADPECEEMVAEAGEVEVEGATVPASEPVELEEPGLYYWQAVYSGGGGNPGGSSPCGVEVLSVASPTSISTTLTGNEEEGSKIEVEEGTPVSDQATLSGAYAATAEGTVVYSVFSDSKCTEFVTSAGEAEVSEGIAEPSEEVTLPHGTYYWIAEYFGDDDNRHSIDSCGNEIATVTTPITASLSGEGLFEESESGEEIQVPVETSVTDHATLHGEHASKATGTVEYFVYADEDCEELIASAGEVEVEGATVPSSEPIEFEEPGVYYWQAEYSGDEENPAATSTCGAETTQAFPTLWKYAALGDSYSSGEGAGSYYRPTNEPFFNRFHGPNFCHRTIAGWPALVAWATFGLAHVQLGQVFQNPVQRFLFRACSGAEIKNIWSGGPKAATEGQSDEYVIGLREWPRKPAQVLWLPLPGPKPNNDFALVSLTIGGNDSGFAQIAKSCMYRVRLVFQYNPKPCQDTIAEWEGKGLKAIEEKLKTALQAIQASAPRASIRVFLYPKVLTRTGTEIEIGPIGPILRVNDVVKGFKDRTAVQSIQLFIEKLNMTITKTVQNSGVPNVTLHGDMVESLVGHRLGNEIPWMNGVALPMPLRESFHPDDCGHRAMGRAALRAMIRNAPGQINLCP